MISFFSQQRDSFALFEPQFFNFGVDDTKINPEDRAPAMNYDDPGIYTPPKQRAAGRPHEVGWLEKLEKLDGKGNGFGAVAPGSIIYED